MRLRTTRIQLVVAMTVPFLVFWAVMASGVAARSQSDSNLEGGCVLAVGDLNGDGMLDYAASDRVANGSPVAYVIFGRGEPLPASVDPRQLTGHSTIILRGPAAVPFTCPDVAIPSSSPRQPMSLGGDLRRRPFIESPIDQPISYTIVDLDPLMGSSVASRLNARGEVVGRSFFPDGEHAFVYEEGGMRDLGTLGGHLSDARDINDAGEIVGYSLTGAVDSFGFIHAPFTSDGVVMRSLNLDWSSAQAINEAGKIVGEMRVTPGVDLSHAFLYDQGAVVDLGSLPPLATAAFSTAHSINAAGQIVGESNTFVNGIQNPSARYPAVHAFLYELGVMRDIGTFGVFCGTSPGGGERCLDRSTATDINKHGQIVGFSTTPSDASTHAFATSGQELRDLGTLGGRDSWAFGANDSGQIVGGSLDANERFVPFLYDRGTMYNLNTLLVDASGDLPFAAYDINNFGQIAGNHHLLTPVYQTVAPGRKLSFKATLGTTLTFEYWVTRGYTATCRAQRDRLRLQIKIDAREGAGTWSPFAEVPGCDDSTDWSTASVAIGKELRRADARIHIRVREAGVGTEPIVHLRHFAME